MNRHIGTIEFLTDREESVMRSRCGRLMRSVWALGGVRVSWGALLAMALLGSAGRADLIDYSNGFPSNPPDLTFNGTARVRLSYAELTNGGESLQAGSFFSNSRCNITSFS